MKLNTLSKLFATKGSFLLSYNLATLLLLGALVALGTATWGGYRLAYWKFAQQQGTLVGQWQQYLQVDKHELHEREAQTEQQLQVLTQHIGRIEANLLRINALGERLVESAHL